jgi:glutathione S-transferase
MPRIPKNLLLERSAEYFYRTRSEVVGIPLEEYAKKEGGEQCWIEAFKALKAMAAFVSETEGPFVEGNEVSYADFGIVSLLFFFKRVQQEDFQRLMANPNAKPLVEQFEACAQWFNKDD